MVTDACRILSSYCLCLEFAIVYRNQKHSYETQNLCKTCSTALVFIIFHFIPRLPLSALQIIDCGGRLCFENMHYSFFFC